MENTAPSVNIIFKRGLSFSLKCTKHPERNIQAPNTTYDNMLLMFRIKIYHSAFAVNKWKFVRNSKIEEREGILNWSNCTHKGVTCD